MKLGRIKRFGTRSPNNRN